MSGSSAHPVDLAVALAAWLAARPETRGPVEVTLLGVPPSGNSNVTLPFVASLAGPDGPTEQRYVLRMQTGANQIFLDPDVGREAAVLRGLEAWPAVPAPRVAVVEPDAGPLGHPFFLMDLIDGIVPHGKPSIHTDGWLPTLDIDRRQALWESAMAALAAIHLVDWRAHHGFLAAGANGTTLPERLDHLTRWYEWVTGGRRFPVADAALAHLRAQVPLDPGPPVLCWGDPRIGNISFRPDGTCAAVLDWELASIGPAGLDLGWWLAMEEFQTGAHGVTPLPGWPDRPATVAHYQALTGADIAPDHLDWYEMLAIWVLTVTVIRMTDIGIANGTLRPTTSMAEGNLTTQMLARRLGLRAPALDPDYARRRGLHPED